MRSKVEKNGGAGYVRWIKGTDGWEKYFDMMELEVSELLFAAERGRDEEGTKASYDEN